MTYPLLDILTPDEVHEALVSKTLERHKKPLTAVDVEAQVVHRNVRQVDGTWQMVSSVVILGKKAPTAPVSDGKKNGG